ncbi:MAG: hypothetical protein AAGN66_11345 [Acidobacteriota bacterium]
MKKLLIVPIACSALAIGCSAGVAPDSVPGPTAVDTTATLEATHDFQIPQLTDASPDGETKMGPPPYGYWRILGDTVPSWSGATPQGRSSMNWTLLGPRPITGEFWSGDDHASGRVVSIAPHPTDMDTIYIGTASGGVWKTTNSGGLWTPISDELANLNHGCVALDPQSPDTVYAGTGEYTTGSDGAGLFRSTDGGATWTQIADTTETGTECSQLLVDPTDSDIIHWTGTQGYARTTDGGATWTNLLAGRASDLALDPSNPQTLYLGKHQDGVYKSTNGGSTWTKLAGGLPTNAGGRVIVALAESAPSTLYATLLLGNNLQGLYKTTDGGTTWTAKPNTPNFPSPQGSYDCFTEVDPTNPDVLYGGGVFPSYAVAGVIKSTDGGDSWTDVTVGTLGGQLHPDMHTAAFDAAGRMWVGNDGGVWYTSDGGLTWMNTNATLSVTQNYAISLHPTIPDRLIGGTQDNGTVARDVDTEDWPQILAGDGGFSAWDFDDPNTRYGTYVRLTTYRLVGSSVINISGPWGGDSRNFIAPLVMDPNDAHTLLGGTSRIWRNTTANTTTGGTASTDWQAISSNFGGRVNAIAVAEGASDTIYAGTTAGQVQVTTDATNWTLRNSGLVGGPVADIFIDPEDPGRAYVSFANLNGARVFLTEDYGVNWTDVTGTLPSGVRAKALEVDFRHSPDHIYVGTGVGVYCSRDNGATWEKDGSDLPNVNIGDLLLHEESNKLYAGTYGRGAWVSQVPGNETVFSDGFEAGNTLSWSNEVID